MNDEPASPPDNHPGRDLALRLLRSAVVGLAAGFGLLWAMGQTPEGYDLPVAVGGMVLLVVGLAGRRWLTQRRSRSPRS